MSDFKIQLKKGAASNIFQVFIRDSSVTTGIGLAGLAFNTANLVAYYHRDNDTTATAISLVTMTVGTFTSGGFKEIDATNMPGYYQFCPPDAAVAAGLLGSVIMLKGATNMSPYAMEVMYVGVDLTASAIPANLTQIDGLATSGNNATLNLKKFNVVNNSGDAAVFSSTGGNGHGISASGNGTGDGMAAVGGLTGHGFLGQGGATSGSGMFLLAVGSGTGLSASGAANGNGVQFSGNGSGSGLSTIGGVTGHGIGALGGAASGNGAIFQAVGSGTGLNVVGVGAVSLLAAQGISGPLDATERNAIADALLKRDFTAVTGEANFSVLNALRFLRNWSISGSTFTAYKEDRLTPAWIGTGTTDAAAMPIVAFSS